MIIGYTRPLRKKESDIPKERQLKEAGVEQIIVDSYAVKDVVNQSSSEFQYLLSDLEEKDVLVVPALERISSDYTKLYTVMQKLHRKNVSIEVLNIANHSPKEWMEILDWIIQNERSFESSLKIVNVGKETKTEKQKYRMFSTDPEARQTYWQIVAQLFMNNSLRKVAKETGLSKATVFRIKKSVEKAKITLGYIALFFVTIVCLKLAQNYSDNMLLQLLICLITTIVIIGLSYSDFNKE